MKNPLRRFALALPIALSAHAAAQDLLVCRDSPARIERRSSVDGSLINASFIDLDGLLNLQGVSTQIGDVIAGPTGEYLVSQPDANAIHRFSADGSTYLGQVAIPDSNGSSPWKVTAMVIDGGTLGYARTAFQVLGNGGGIASHDLLSMATSPLATGYTVTDLTPFGDDWLTSLNGQLALFDPTTGGITPWANMPGFARQSIVLPDGRVMVADSVESGYTIFDGFGNVLQSVAAADAGAVRGLAQLSNGSVLLSGPAGLFTFDPISGVSNSLGAGFGSHITVMGEQELGTNYCVAIPNSTGSAGRLTATGNRNIAFNNVTLRASSLPANATGYFITSTVQGFSASPGGSMGNLCLGGTAIGRYVGPGQVGSSGSQGELTLSLDLSMMPQPNGSLAVQPGESWNFQAWHRDTVGTQATSNFTEGLSITFE